MASNVRHIEECFNVVDVTYVEITLNHLRNSVHSDDRAKNNGTFSVWKSVCIKAIATQCAILNEKCH